MWHNSTIHLICICHCCSVAVTIFLFPIPLFPLSLSVSFSVFSFSLSCFQFYTLCVCPWVPGLACCLLELQTHRHIWECAGREGESDQNRKGKGREGKGGSAAHPPMVKGHFENVLFVDSALLCCCPSAFLLFPPLRSATPPRRGSGCVRVRVWVCATTVRFSATPRGVESVAVTRNDELRLRLRLLSPNRAYAHLD